MATLHGKNGSIAWSGTAGFIETSVTSWTVDATADTAECTNMTSSEKEYLAGFLDWTATIETVWSGDEDILDDLGDDNSGSGFTVDLFLVAAGENLTGPAICTGVSPTTDKDDVVRISYSFQGTGTLARAAS